MQVVEFAKITRHCGVRFCATPPHVCFVHLLPLFAAPTLCRKAVRNANDFMIVNDNGSAVLHPYQLQATISQLTAYLLNTILLEHIYQLGPSNRCRPRCCCLPLRCPASQLEPVVVVWLLDCVSSSRMWCSHQTVASFSSASRRCSRYNVIFVPSAGGSH